MYWWINFASQRLLQNNTIRFKYKKIKLVRKLTYHCQVADEPFPQICAQWRSSS